MKSMSIETRSVKKKFKKKGVAIDPIVHIYID